MRAAQFGGIREPVRVREMQVPEIDEGDALVRVITCGICRSDWHLWNGDWQWFGVKLLQPAVLGHEIGGVVEKVGSSVRLIQPGMRVTIPFHLACGYCPYCRSGEQNLCENRIVLQRTPGSGGWAQYMRARCAGKFGNGACGSLLSAQGRTVVSGRVDLTARQREHFSSYGHCCSK